MLRLKIEICCKSCSIHFAVSITIMNFKAFHSSTCRKQSGTLVVVIRYFEVEFLTAVQRELYLI